MSNFAGFGATTVAPEAMTPTQEEGFGGYSTPPQQQFAPAPTGGFASASPQPNAGGGSLNAGLTMAGMANTMAVATGAGGLSALSGGLGPAGIVFGAILPKVIGKLLGKKEKKPRYALASRPLNSMDGIEDGAAIQSRLTSIGFDTAQTKDLKAGDIIDQLQPLVEADNTLYEFFDPAARKAIQENFSWNGAAMDMTEDALINRYQGMLNVAASASPGARNAQRVVADMFTDYAAGFSAMREGGSEAERELYNRYRQERELTAGAPIPTGVEGENEQLQSSIDQLHRSQEQELDGTMRSLIEASRRGDRSIGDRSSDELMAIIQSEMDAQSGVANLDQKYAAYQQSGGRMNRERFAATFAPQQQVLMSGQDPRERRVQNANPGQHEAMAGVPADVEYSYTPGHGRAYGDSQLPIPVSDYMQYMMLGLNGNSYEDIISGNYQNQRAVQEPAQPQVFAGFGGGAFVDDEATQRFRGFGGLGAGG